jgi:hypothetical protein
LLPQVKAMLKGLESAVAAVKVPEVLATNQPGLKAWRQDRRETYRETIESVYSEATRRLEDMRTSAVATAEARARELAPPPSPMDDGPTGDWILDQTLAAFDEVLVGALGFKELQVRSSQDAVRVVELFEVFSTFASRSGPDEGPVEEAMQGRIMLFVGGDETASAPRAVLVFRDDSAPTPRPLVLAQVTRHRIMRGRTLVADYGWRPAANTPAPGMPRTETMDQFLIAPHVEPTMDTSSPYYQQLRDMRIVVDTQSGFFDEAGALLGGVDWRIEFSVSARGDLTWQLAGGKPVFDPYCAEIRRTLGR